MTKRLYPVAIIASMMVISSGLMLASIQDCAYAAGSACSYPHSTSPPAPPAPPVNAKNFLIIVTDDQRFDTLQYMPIVKARMVDQGVNFNHTVATSPYCCPARASFMAGGLPAYETNVLSIVPPIGGAGEFNDTTTIATELQKAGYKTGLVGKYLNKYETLNKRVPPGWTLWEGAYPGYGSNTNVITGSSTYEAATTGIKHTMGSYSTYYFRDKALAFLDQYKDDPFFLYVGFNAPHAPFDPATGDDHTFDGFNYTSPGVLESDLTDKSPIVQASSHYGDAAHYEEIRLHSEMQLETLPAVDRSVDAILDKLDELGIADNTIVIFTSDNGYMWNEHGGMQEKKLAYEESIRVPMTVLYPGATPKNIDDKLVSWNIDIPATIIDIAGINMYTEGQSLKPLILGTPVTWNNQKVLQEWGGDDVNYPIFTWAEYRDMDWAYIEYASGAKELYDLTTDPYELSSLAGNATYNALMANLSSIIDDQRGLTIITTSPLTAGTVGNPYTKTFTTWGGTAPLTWSLESGALPAGLTLDASTGVLSGTPTQSGTYTFSIRVTDSSILPVIGVHERYIMSYSLTVNP